MIAEQFREENDQWLATIVADPADMCGRRLIYADWLEERQSRIQCPTCSGTKVTSFAGLHKKIVRRLSGQPFMSYQRGQDYQGPCNACWDDDGEPTGTLSDGCAELAELIRIGHQKTDPLFSHRRHELDARATRILCHERLHREWYSLDDQLGWSLASASRPVWIHDDSGSLSAVYAEIDRGFVGGMTGVFSAWIALGPYLVSRWPIRPELLTFTDLTPDTFLLDGRKVFFWLPRHRSECNVQLTTGHQPTHAIPTDWHSHILLELRTNEVEFRRGLTLGLGGNDRTAGWFSQAAAVASMRQAAVDWAHRRLISQRQFASFEDELLSSISRRAARVRRP